MKPAELALTLPAYEAWAFAQFLKRAGYSEYRALAVSDEEAKDMREAGEKLRQALAEQGYAPR